MQGGLGLVLCEGQKNEGVIPLNKNLWSLSFILVMGGSAFILLAIFHFVIDIILWWSGAPFKYPGMYIHTSLSHTHTHTCTLTTQTMYNVCTI